MLTSPPLAPALSERLAELLRLQGPGGEWPRTDYESSEGKETTTFAHGTTDLIISLLSLRPFFPSLQERIDEVMTNARDFVVRTQHGLSAADLSLWYGVLGTIL